MKRNMIVLSLVMLLLLGFTILASAQVTLRHWDWHQPRMDIKLGYMEEYKEINPGVEFDTQVVGWEDYWTRLMSGVAGGDVPDIAQFHNAYTMDFLNHLVPYPQDLYSVENMKEDFVNFEAAYMFDGEFYFYPVGVMSGLIFYNKDMWAEAGYTEADIPTSWDDFTVIAKDLTKYDNNGDVEIAGFAFNGFLGEMWVDLNYQKGGTFYNDGAESVNWNTEAGIEALQLLEGMLNEDRVTQAGFLGGNEALGTGNAAMAYCWSWLSGQLDGEYPDINYGAFRLPTFDGKLAPGPIARNNGETGMAVMASSDEKQLASFEFLKWLYEETDYLVDLNLVLGTAPARKDLLNNPRITANPIIAALAEQIPYTNIPGEIPGDIEQGGGLRTIADLIFYGASSEEALATAEEEANNVLKERPVLWYVEDLYVPVKE